MKNFNKFLSLKGISMVGFEAKEQTEKDSLLKDYDNKTFDSTFENIVTTPGRKHIRCMYLQLEIYN